MIEPFMWMVANICYEQRNKYTDHVKHHQYHEKVICMYLTTCRAQESEISTAVIFCVSLLEERRGLGINFFMKTKTYHY